MESENALVFGKHFSKCNEMNIRGVSFGAWGHEEGRGPRAVLSKLSLSPLRGHKSATVSPSLLPCNYLSRSVIQSTRPSSSGRRLLPSRSKTVLTLTPPPAPSGRGNLLPVSETPAPTLSQVPRQGSRR